MNINVSCEKCGESLEVVREWSEQGDVEITVGFRRVAARQPKGGVMNKHEIECCSEALVDLQRRATCLEKGSLFGAGDFTLRQTERGALLIVWDVGGERRVVAGWRDDRFFSLSEGNWDCASLDDFWAVVREGFQRLGGCDADLAKTKNGAMRGEYWRYKR